MKLFLAAAVAVTIAAPAYAQDPHAGHAGHAAPTAAAAAASARLNLDTPIETLMADAGGKAVLDKLMPGMDKHPQYEMAKAMSLRQVAGFAPQQFTPEVLGKIEADLAAVK